MKINKKILSIFLIAFIFINILNCINPLQLLAKASEPDFTIYSEGAILIDSNSGKVLYGKNENEKLYPASTTKIITAILAIENCNPSEKIKASYNAVMSIPAGYSNAAIQPDETLTVDELLNLFLIHSANEVGYIFAEHISGSVEDFAELMNKKATELGCKNTHFTNPSGIHSAEHYSTAYDMALIARYCMKNETFRNIVSKKSCTVEATDKYEKRYFKNTNSLIDPSSKYYYEYAIGTKTGYTSQAKRCLISTSLKDGLELITVTLGAESSVPDTRYEDTINLFEYGYSNYKEQKIISKDTVVKDINIKGATKETQSLSLVTKNELQGIIPSDIEISSLNPSIELNSDISAPIEEGVVLGKITYNIEEFQYSTELIASHSVEKFDVLKMTFQIVLALFVLFVLFELFFNKKKFSKNKKRKKKQNKRNFDSTYKF